eukprot:SAG31_NODE_984_length_10552_cov_4.679231_4_plen_192_part_00
MLSDASKDFLDTSSIPSRRILWGWVELGQGALSLPREITWHPQLQQLVFSPIPELEMLRVRPLGTQPAQKAGEATPLPSNATILLGCADTVEVKAVFKRPMREARLGVYIAADRSQRSGYWYFIEYEPPPPAATTGAGYNITVGRTRLPVSSGRYKRVMHGVDLVGADYNSTSVKYKDYRQCQAACDASIT